MDNIGTRIRDFLIEEVVLPDGADALTDQTPLLSGVVDSLALLQLVAFLEEEFNVEIDDADMVAGHFRTIADIEELVKSKVNAA